MFDQILRIVGWILGGGLGLIALAFFLAAAFSPLVDLNPPSDEPAKE